MTREYIKINPDMTKSEAAREVLDQEFQIRGISGSEYRKDKIYRLTGTNDGSLYRLELKSRIWKLYTGGQAIATGSRSSRSVIHHTEKVL